MLELKEVAKIFSRPNETAIEAVHDISASLHEREFVVFVGPSGCGKTTLLKIIAGLEYPTTGKVIFDGENIGTTGRDRGMVFQDFALFPWLTVKENIAFGLRLQKMPEEKIKDMISYYLKITGLEQFSQNYPTSLSGGMQQRVAIVRTLANNPKILLMDEPFGALDLQTRSKMQGFLSKLWEDSHKTVVFVTHDIEEAIFLADRVFLLSKRPATIKQEFKIEFPRPRTHDLKFDDKFFTLKKQIAQMLEY
jgi:NitT/TauT family transport system ATP-binding protein